MNEETRDAVVVAIELLLEEFRVDIRSGIVSRSPQELQGEVLDAVDDTPGKL